jgi:hypothetical protein
MFRWQWHWTDHFDACFVGDGFELDAHVFQLLEVGACQANPCFSRHCHASVF